ncbi:MAG TPA: 16S rRNA (adenine(1518)-N(6)/adenine(1519)-N(6))-dimethyltransferase RsmA [Pantanalinema sp.]
MTTSSTPGFRTKKRFGQNFLKDPAVPAAIVEAAELTKADKVLEIGPGQGALTRGLLEEAGEVVAVEIDTRLTSTLEALQAEQPHLRVVWGDFLATSFAELGLSEAGTKVVANIPYYITSPILLKLLHSETIEREPLESVAEWPERIILMVQEEVARRLLARPGTKDYGSLSVICQYAAEITPVIRVPRSSFVPRPQVDSMVVMLKPRKVAPIDVPDPRRFFQVVRGAFGLRRKTLVNALKGAGFEQARLEAAFAATGIDPARRGETLSLEEFAALSRALL